jgi:hypothetical protein
MWFSCVISAALNLSVELSRTDRRTSMDACEFGSKSSSPSRTEMPGVAARKRFNKNDIEGRVSRSWCQDNSTNLQTSSDNPMSSSSMGRRGRPLDITLKITLASFGSSLNGILPEKTWKSHNMILNEMAWIVLRYIPRQWPLPMHRYRLQQNAHRGHHARSQYRVARVPSTDTFHWRGDWTSKRSSWSDHLQLTSNQSRRCTLVQRNWQGCSPWNKCICKLSSETRKQTYPLQITVYDIEWMEILETLTNIHQLDKKDFSRKLVHKSSMSNVPVACDWCQDERSHTL